MGIDRRLLPEIATTRDGRDITRGFVDAMPLLPPTDRVFAGAGGWRGYEELLRDDQVAAVFAQRRLAVVSRPWAVDPGGPRRIDQRAAELVRETLDRVDWDGITDRMLYARFFGVAVAEVIWAADAGGVRVDDLRVRDRARFGFAPDGALKLLTSSKPDGEAMPERKFWVCTVGASHHDEPYGRGLAHQLYWPVWFKRQGARFWAVYLEKFGAPTAVGKFPAIGTADADRDKLLDAVRAVQTDSGIVIPEGMEIALLEAARGGQAGYEAWMSYWDKAISKVVVGQTMTTDDGASRSQAQVHMAVRAEVVAADADLVCATANRSWVRWLVDLVLPGAAYPLISRDMAEPEDMKVRADRDAVLAGLGIRLKPQAVVEVYGDQYELSEPKRDELDGTDGTGPADAGGEPAGAGEAGEDEPDDDEGGGVATAAEATAADDGAGRAANDPAADDPTADDPTAADADELARAAQPTWQALLDRLRTLVDEAADADALQRALVDAYGGLDTAPLTRIMAAAFALAQLKGLADAAAGA